MKKPALNHVVSVVLSCKTASQCASCLGWVLRLAKSGSLNEHQSIDLERIINYRIQHLISSK